MHRIDLPTSIVTVAKLILMTSYILSLGISDREKGQLWNRKKKCKVQIFSVGISHDSRFVLLPWISFGWRLLDLCDKRKDKFQHVFTRTQNSDDHPYVFFVLSSN